MLRYITLTVLLALTLPTAADPAPASPSALDLLPLKKALAPLSGTGALKVHSTIRVTGVSQGTAQTLHEALLVTALRPGRFHAELTQFDALGAPKKKLVLISNGTLVWTYRPGLRQYSVTSLQAFRAAENDVSTLGLVVAGFYLGDGHPLVQGFRGITSGNSAEVLSALSGMDIALSRRTKSVAGHDDYVYSLAMTKQTLTYQFYVDNETNTLTRIDLSGIQEGTHLSYREDIAGISPRSVLPKSTFQFTPPPGTAKVTAVSLSPF